MLLFVLAGGVALASVVDVDSETEGRGCEVGAETEEVGYQDVDSVCERGRRPPRSVLDGREEERVLDRTDVTNSPY